MSKTAPAALNDSFVNMGLLATLVGTLGRVVGDRLVEVFVFAARHDKRKTCLICLIGSVKNL